MTNGKARLTLALALGVAAPMASAQDDYGGEFGGESAGSSRSHVQVSRMGPVPDVHVVQRGDTLWDISGSYFDNPWDWPRIWALNPEIANPHWIYPDNRIRLRGEVSPEAATLPGAPAAAVPPRLQLASARGGRGASGTVYLRQLGFLDADALARAGEVVGSPDEQLLLSDHDPIYLRFEDEDHRPAPGTQLTVFRAIEANERTRGEEGTLVRILGTVRIDSWDPARKVAIGEVIEAVEPIERGYPVAEVPRRMELVAPVASSIDLEGRVIALMYQRELLAQHQFVFVDKGGEDGVREGNRFQIVRQLDGYDATRARSSSPTAEFVSMAEDPDHFPVEVVAEGIVVDVRPHSATVFMTASTREVQLHERAVMRRGY